MKIVEKYISLLVESQFPDFYKEQGPIFILFVEEYFKWLESNGSEYSSYNGTVLDGNPLYHIRRLLEYRDLDLTADEFLIYFKEKYFKGIQTTTNISQRNLLKAAHDIFASKGTERSFDLLFKLVYGVKVEIYRPGDDLLRPSDGKWVTPQYLELSRSPRTAGFVGKMITGSISGATAFVEYVITRNIKGKIIDIIFLSDISGQFATGEIVTDDNITLNAPKVIGSLSNIDITSGGELFSVGETVNVVSARGIGGLARVTGVDSVTGIVRFTILDGGWGFSNTATTEVSDKVLVISNFNDPDISTKTIFNRYEIVSQNLFSFAFTDAIGTIQTDTLVINRDGTPSESTPVSVTQLLGANSGTVILNQLSGNVFSNSIFLDKNKSYVFTHSNTQLTVGTSVVQYDGASNNVGGVISDITDATVITIDTSSLNSNGIHTGVFIQQTTSNASGYISYLNRETNYLSTNVSIIALSNVSGTFTNTSTITAYANNLKGVTYGTFTPTNATTSKKIYLINTNTTSNTRWSTSNTIIKVGDPTINSSIIMASDVGGKLGAYSNVSVTANVIGSNTTAIGIIDITSGLAFYSNSKTRIYSLLSNSTSNVTSIFSGQNADFSIGSLQDYETVRLSPDRVGANNDGYLSNSVMFADMFISGANSTYGILNGVLIIEAGSGYNNTNIVTFTGGNNSTGHEVGNASIITDNTGVILSVGLSANVGNNIVSTPSLSVVNSTGGSTGVGSGANLVPISAYGFVKLPGGDASNRIIDLLRFPVKTIGSIASLTAINPGENYTSDPFVLVVEPDVSAYDKKDLVLEIDFISGPGFIVGENVEQTLSIPEIQIISNNFTGNSTVGYDYSEVVYSTDGIVNTATGIIRTSSIDDDDNVTVLIGSNTRTFTNTVNATLLTVSTNTNFTPGDTITQDTVTGILVNSNTTTLVVKSVTGAFAANSTAATSNTGGSSLISATSNTKIFKLLGATSNGSSDIIYVDTVATSIVARGTVKSNSNNEILYVKRISLFTEFVGNTSIVGRSTGTVANVISSYQDITTRAVGDNANIVANVVFSEGTISNVVIDDSGFGYEDSEGVSLVSLDGLRAASGRVNLIKQGVATGYFSSSDGFLSDRKYLHDGDYYQNYSYEIRTSIPLDVYKDVLTSILHVAGEKYFGRLSVQSDQSINVTVPYSNVTQYTV